MENLSSQNKKNAQGLENKEDIVRQIIELQRSWNQYVAEKPPEFILELYEKNLLRFEADSEGKITAVLYIQPLDESLPPDDPNQVFRVGGLATSSSPGSKRALVRMLHQLKIEVLGKKMNIIGRTDNSVLAEYLKDMGMEELAFEECQKKYPKFLELYLKKSSREDKMEYLDKKFYVKTTLKNNL